MRRAGPVLIATIVAGGAGYAAIAIASVLLLHGDFLVFASLWASVFFVAGSVGGWQAEVTRAAHGNSVGSRRPLVLAGLAVALVAIALAIVWNGALAAAGAEPGLRGILPVAVGAVGAVGLGTLAGMASGAERWRLLAALLSAEGLLRFVLVTTVLVTGGGYGLLAGAMVVPAGGVTAVVVSCWRRVGLGDVVVDGGTRLLVRRAVATIAAATAMSAVVSALPAIITLRTDGISIEVVEGAQAVIQLARAPLVVLALALQGFAVVAFRARPERTRRLPLWVAGLAAAGALIAGPAALVGPSLMDAVYGGHKVISAGVAASLVGSAPLLMAVFMVGAAALARGMHGTYVVTWVVVAAATLAVLISPLGFDARLVWAVTLPPILGAGYGLWRLRIPQAGRLA